MALATNEIRDALKSNNRTLIAQTYSAVFGKPIDRNCGSCISDARIALQSRVNELERESAPIILYVGVYEDKNPERQDELEECLYQNQNNPHISKVVEVRDRRPTFQNLFDLFDENAINVIVNSDIFFTETIQLAKLIKPNQAFALCRYDWNGNGHAKFINRYDAQDAWVFRGKIKKKIYADFHLGIPGCDNRLAYELKKAGYLVTNPSLSIHALHYHTSQVRHYNSKTPAVAQPYHFVHPCAL